MTKEVSAVIVVSERSGDIQSLHESYRDALDQSGKSYEILYVLDGSFPEVRDPLMRFREAGESIRLIELGKSYGEATALSVALRETVGNTILTLPAYAQVKLDDLDRLLAKLAEVDVILAVRYPRADGFWNRLQAGAFKSVLRFISGKNYRDLGCGVRAFKRQVFDTVPVYGDLHRFLPLLAEQAGFGVAEFEMPQATEDTAPRVYGFGVYLRRLLDMLTVFFLVKFTKKPLRFFGLIGAGTAGVGFAALLWLIVERTFFAVGLADRPALLLSTLLFAVGIQLIAVGLIGELIIFTHARELKEYSIERIAEASSSTVEGTVTDGGHQAG